MEDSKDGTTNASIQLLEPQRIVSCKGVELELEKENLSQVLQSCMECNHSIAFLAVIGPQRSAKSLLTNFIIQYFKNPNSNAWMVPLINNGKFAEGFHFDSVATCKELFAPVRAEDADGVYIWPEPFILKKLREPNLLVWILHYQITCPSKEYTLEMQEKAERYEAFLWLACSRLVEIWTGKEEIRAEKIWRTILSKNDDSNYSGHPVCDSLVVIHLGEDIKSSQRVLRQTEAKNSISSIRVKYELCKAIDESKLLEKMQYVNFIRIPKTDRKLHDKSGQFLKENFKSVGQLFKMAVNALLEEDEVRSKVLNESTSLSIRMIPEFLKECIGQVNQLRIGTRNISLSLSDVPKSENLGKTDVVTRPKDKVELINKSHFATRTSLDTDRKRRVVTGKKFPVLRRINSKPLSTTKHRDRKFADELANPISERVIAKEGNTDVIHSTTSKVQLSDSENSVKDNVQAELSKTDKCNEVSKIEMKATSKDIIVDKSASNDACSQIDSSKNLDSDISKEAQQKPLDTLEELVKVNIVETLESLNSPDKSEMHQLGKSKIETPVSNLDKQKYIFSNDCDSTQKVISSVRFKIDIVHDKLDSPADSLLKKSYSEVETCLSLNDLDLECSKIFNEKMAQGLKVNLGEATNIKELTERRMSEQPKITETKCSTENLNHGSFQINECMLPVKDSENNSEAERRRKERRRAADEKRRLREVARIAKENEEYENTKKESITRHERQRLNLHTDTKPSQPKEMPSVHKEIVKDQQREEPQGMDQFVDTALLVVKSNLLTFFMRCEVSNVHDLSDISNMYKQCLNSILEYHFRQKLPSQMWKKFHELVCAAYYDKGLALLSNLLKPVRTLHADLVRQRDLYIYLPTEEFDVTASKLLECNVNNMDKYDNHVNESLVTYMKRIIEMHRIQNLSIIQFERKIRDQLSLQVKDFYKEEMKRYITENSAFMKDELCEIHVQLCASLVDSSAKLVKVSPTDDVQSWMEQVKQDLNVSFEEFKTMNDTRLLKIEQSSFLSNRYKTFAGEMKKKIMELGDCDQSSLESVYHALSQEQENVLKEEAKERSISMALLRMCCRVFRKQMRHFWEAQMETRRNSKQKRNLIPHDGQADCTTAIPPSKTTDEKVQKVEQEVGKITFRLTEKHVFMATVIDKKLQQLKNKNDEYATPLLVGINQCYDLVFGTDVTKQCEGLESWSITRMIREQSSEPSICQANIRVGVIVQTCVISFEFLLGYIFAGLKQHAENLLQKSFGKAVLTVPTWFNSTKRIQVKDALRVAGFTDTMILNEENAVVYTYALKPLKDKKYILTISEGNGLISAALHSNELDLKGPRTRMLCYNICEADSEKQKASSSNRAWLPFNPFTSKMKADEDNLKRGHVDNLIRNMLLPSFNFYWPISSILISESDSEWSNTCKFVLDKGHYGALSELKIDGLEHVGMIGATKLSELSASSIGNLIENFHSFDSFKCFLHSRHGELKFKKSLSSDNVATIQLPPNAKQIQIFQICLFTRSEVLVGTFVPNQDIPHGQITLEFELNFEGIFHLKHVNEQNLESTSGYFRNNFQWVTPNIKDVKRNDIRDLIRLLLQPTESGVGSNEESRKILETKQELVKLCDFIETRTSNGAYTFKSDVGMDNLKKRIELARSLVNEEVVSVDRIKREYLELQIADEKYSKPR